MIILSSLSETRNEIYCITLNWVIYHKSVLKPSKSSQVVSRWYFPPYQLMCPLVILMLTQDINNQYQKPSTNQTVMQLQPNSCVDVGCHLSQIRGRRLSTSCEPPEGGRILYFFWAHGPLSWGTRRHQIGSRREQLYSFPSCPGIDRPLLIQQNPNPTPPTPPTKTPKKDTVTR